MSIENIEQLINSLQIVKKQLVEQNQISAIDKEVLKKQFVQFYESNFFNNTSTVVTNQTPIATNVSNPFLHEVKSNIEVVKQETPITTNNTNPFLHEVKTNIEKVNEEVAMQQQISAPTVIEEIEPIAIVTENVQVVESLAAPVPTPTPIPTVSAADIIREEVRNEMVFNTSKAEEPVVIQAAAETTTETSSSSIGLNDKFNVKSSSLNERFQSASSIADKFEQSNKSMSELIDLNKRLLFVDVLFSGNIQLYNQVLQHIDDYKSASEAIHFVEFNKAKLQITEKKETVYKSFLEIIQKKFN